MSQRSVFKRTALVSFVALVLLPLSACKWNREYVLNRLPVGENRSIIILAETAGEVSTGIFYQVRIGEKTVTSTCLICFAAKDPGSLSFKVLSARSGNLIAVYEETDPERIVVIHDFSLGISWPRGAPEESGWQINSRGQILLKQLQQEYPNSNLKLNPGGACGIRLSGN